MHGSQAGIAQLVERNLAKVEVASSSLVSRSRLRKGPASGVFSYREEVFLPVRSTRLWPGSRVVMQRIANPRTPVRFRPRPPFEALMIQGFFFFWIAQRAGCRSVRRWRACRAQVAHAVGMLAIRAICRAVAGRVCRRHPRRTGSREGGARRPLWRRAAPAARACAEAPAGCVPMTVSGGGFSAAHALRDCARGDSQRRDPGVDGRAQRANGAGGMLVPPRQPAAAIRRPS